MELWDILDVTGNKTGRTIVRGQPLREGEYHIAVHIYIINNKKEFLIQKRSMKKDLWPGQWDVTAGAVVSGEDSLTGAIREVEEELGITLMPEKFLLITRLHRKDYFIDVWAAFADVSLENIIMQADEVDEVRYVKAEDMINIIFNAENNDAGYKEVMTNYIKTLE
jgi:8-oxo-dGTP diphosphatase